MNHSDNYAAEAKLQLTTSSLYKSVIVFIAAILGLVFVYLIRDVLILFVLASILAYAVNPLVAWLDAHRIRRIFSVIMVIGGLVAASIVGISYLIPAIIDQVQGISASIPSWVRDANSIWTDLVDRAPFLGTYQIDTQAIVDQATAATQPVLGLIQGVIALVVGLVLVIVIALYALVDPYKIKNSLLRLVPPNQNELANRLIKQVNLRIGGWLRGIISIAIITSTISYIFYAYVVKIPYALTLAVFTGLFETIPILGPIIAGVVAGAVAFFHEPILGLYVVLFITLTRLITDYYLAPKIMGHQVGIHPLAIIFSVLVMAEIVGLVGIFLAVPVAAIFKIIIDEVYVPRISGRPSDAELAARIKLEQKAAKEAE